MICINFLFSKIDHSICGCSDNLASSPGHSQILSRSCGIKSGSGLGTRLVITMCRNKVKDTLPLGKQSNDIVVYRIPCSHGQVYSGETRWRLETRLKEHRDGCEMGMMEKSAVAEHAWENHHPIHWKETTVLDHGRGKELLVKEALRMHIQMTPSEERFN